MNLTRTTVLATVALSFLRIVIGLHFFLEGSSHLRDPAWSSAGFRKAAVGPLADFLQSDLPEVGDWSATLGNVTAPAAADVDGPAEAWRASVVAGWRRLWQRRLAATAVGPTRLWKADRFVSWSLVTIGAALVVGLLTKFHAVGGICFLLSVVASQPFWLPAAQATYEQWVEIAGLLVLASVPAGGWTGLDYFLMPLVKGCCPFSACRRAAA